MRLLETDPRVVVSYFARFVWVRAVIDQIREIRATPDMEIAVGGGVFNRAEGLAESIGVSRSARTPLDLVRTLQTPAAIKVQAKQATTRPARMRAVA